MNDLKQKIKLSLHNQENVVRIERMLEEYEAVNPMDLDLCEMKARYQLMQGNVDEAYNIVKHMIQRNPYNWEANMVARDVCCAAEEYIEAIHYESILAMLNSFFPELSYEDSCMEEIQDKMMQQYEAYLKKKDTVRISQYHKAIVKMKNDMEIFWGLFDETFFGKLAPIIGKTYQDVFGNRKYNAYYNYFGVGTEFPQFQEFCDNWIVTKLESRAVTRKKDFVVGDDAEYLLPILQEERGIIYKAITPDGKEIGCTNKREYHFEYYRLPPATKIEADQEVLFGNPIALKQDEKNKKLVLNIFVDGISQKLIEEVNFAEIMPKTNQFFSKGIRCSNVYSASEWTLPSLATYWTGVSSVNHMLIHKQLMNTLPADLTTLAEYFKEQGYETAKIDGDWRSTQSYGYGRGVDRILYQHQNTGMRVDQVIPDVINHIELMKETNQFIWMCVGDLHDVADGFAGASSVQAKIPLENRLMEEIGPTSVKQNYSVNKRIAYIEQMRYIDRYLGNLYQYIEENYKDDEIVISLFGDHGQGYFVEENEHFLSEGRSKVGMMFRGGFEQGTVCHELISTCDYLPILCKLAGIPLKNEPIEGTLPIFFGGDQNREYVITESIHPGDLYMAAIVSEEDTYYFTSGGTVGYDGRFELGNYTGSLLGRDGMECHDKEKIQYYFNILIQHIGGLLIY